MTKRKKRVVIVGGGAAGSSCATRLRRLSEDTAITLFERGPYVSLANCGLPYTVGSIVDDGQPRLIASPAAFQETTKIDVRVNTEVTAIDREQRFVKIRDLTNDRFYSEPYDALVLAPGSVPVLPSVPGLDLPGVFSVRDSLQATTTLERCESQERCRAVVMGAGFTGFELVDTLSRKGYRVAFIEMTSGMWGALDPEMSWPLEQRLRERGVTIHRDRAVEGIHARGAGSLQVEIEAGHSLTANLVVVQTAVRPDTALAENCGLDVGPDGGIQVDTRMRTHDPRIWAVGDVVESVDFVTGRVSPKPLWGSAVRQGRTAASAILRRQAEFRGVQGSGVCRVMDMTAAMTGATEWSLARNGIAYKKIYIHPGYQPVYYPKASPSSFKLLFSPKNGRILGAQMVGEVGVERRIDVLAMAIQKRSTVFDLEDAELCDSPEFGASKDPVNVAGMVAANIVRGDVISRQWEDLDAEDMYILDVRDKHEFELGHVPGAVNIPLGEIRNRIHELPNDQEIWVYCQLGERSYYATRILRLHGIAGRNLSGGFHTYQAQRDHG